MSLEFRKPFEYDNVFCLGLGAFLPGEAVGNDRIDQFIAPINRQSTRIKNRVLADNGILTRHYAIDEQGRTQFSAVKMAAQAVSQCLEKSGVGLGEISFLCTGTSGGDLGMPGFANMLQGELGAAPMETSSHQGVCAAGMAALKHAAAAVHVGQHAKALVATSEFPSRMFKHSRFAPCGYNADFDSHFLRWMLSDGAGAMVLGSRPAKGRMALRLKWVHLRSFSGDHPVCMQIGQAENGSNSYLDYDSLADAERDGAFQLRQNLRLLPNLFDIGIHEYVQLVKAVSIDPGAVDHFLCHYSSEKFRGVIDDLMQAAGVMIPQNRWYSNLTRRGNTGAASIFIMLSDFLNEVELKAGQQILCFVPESGRFTVSFFMLQVEEEGHIERNAPCLSASVEPVIAPPHLAAPMAEGPIARLLRDLAEVWHHYRSRLWRTNLVRKITSGTLTIEDYRRWMECWTPQVREGTLWMRRAIDNLDGEFGELRDLIHQHAGEEQFDYRVLFDDYRRAGGNATHVDALRRNAGGEELNIYMHSRAAMLNPVGLLGGIYIIEGTGQRIIPALLPLLRQ